ncbi:hypothetical protein VKT23_006521 [Stygiomarasmius scandens]|uniref:Uncharacterized protein n=1 Tax=Marasmiellus scandens TaxID=2682957 RepID=A0ABR1JRC2_9AGAR
MAAHLPMTSSIPNLSEFARIHRRELKQRLVSARTAFREDKEARENLEHYLQNDESFNYETKWRKGFVPASLVGTGRIPYTTTSTFFSDFGERYPDLVLSESDRSYIIGNRASYDTRQYTAEWDPSGEDKARAAGMSYMHLLVISKKQQVWNIVGLEDTEDIEEMMTHFLQFWQTTGAVDKVNKRIERAVHEREQEVINSLEKDESKRKGFRDVMESVEDYRKKCAERLHADKDAIVFRFHAWPDASIPHLHMHVLTSPEEFRKYSTPAHDCKAIPADIVLEVIKSENNPAMRIYCFIIDPMIEGFNAAVQQLRKVSGFFFKS